MKMTTGVFFLGLATLANATPTGFKTGEMPMESIPCYANASKTWDCHDQVEAKAPIEEKVAVAAPQTPAPSIAGKVNFELDKHLIDASAKKELDGLAQWMKANPVAKVQVDGYADHTGTSAHNMALSERRALEVKSYLNKQGIESGRISTKAYGDTAESERKAVIKAE